MSPAWEDPGLDPLAQLEERIREAAEVIPRLREEKEAALAERDDALAQLQQAQTQYAKLAKELEGLRHERQQVRTRIEKLLGHLDVLTAG
ncbi:MAG: cell division protein ZapB [Bryobacteraceae bacterium]|nr:cell division protein ZapB [Bryobacteraceae bacterium]